MRRNLLLTTAVVLTLAAPATLFAQQTPVAPATPPAVQAGAQAVEPGLQQALGTLRAAQQAAQAGDAVALQQARTDIIDALIVIREALGAEADAELIEGIERAEGLLEAEPIEVEAVAEVIDPILVEVERVALVEGDVEATEVMVEQPAPEVVVEQPAPEIVVQQPEPQIAVQQPAPDITVQQAQPQVTVEQVPPQIAIEQPEPQVAIAQPEPEVIVEQAEPEVVVEQAEPVVEVEQAQPEVVVEQAEPEVAVVPAEPVVEVERAGEPVVVVEPAGEAEVVGAEAEVAAEEVDPVDAGADPVDVGEQAAVEEIDPVDAGADPVDAGEQVAALPEGVNAEDLIGREVVGPAGEELGEISDLILTSDGAIERAIITYGGFLGVGAERVALEWDRLRLAEEGEQIIAAIAKEELEALPEYEYAEGDNALVGPTE